MTAHDHLRRQLLDGVAALGLGAADRLGEPGRGGRRRRGSLLVAILVLAVSGGVATAATQLLRATPGDSALAQTLVLKVVNTTTKMAPCRPAPLSFVDDAPPPQVAAVFGDRTAPIPARARAQLRARTAPIPKRARAQLRRNGIGQVLTRTVRLARFASGDDVLAYVSRGGGLLTPTDPDDCERVQRALLLRLHPEKDAVQRIALRHMRRMWDAQRREILWLDVRRRGDRGSSGAGVALRPGEPLPTGVVLGGASYAGIAAPRAETIALASKHANATRPIRRTVVISERLFAFKLPRGTGPVELRQLAADGSTVARETLRR